MEIFPRRKNVWILENISPQNSPMAADFALQRSKLEKDLAEIQNELAAIDLHRKGLVDRRKEVNIIFLN